MTIYEQEFFFYRQAISAVPYAYAAVPPVAAKPWVRFLDICLIMYLAKTLTENITKCYDYIVTLQEQQSSIEVSFFSKEI